MKLIYYLFAIIIFIMAYLFINYIVLRYRLGTLTGKYTHIKKASGNLLLVQHKLNGEKIFLLATEKDKLLLKQLNYLL